MSKWFYGLVFAVICFIGSLVTWYYNAIWLPGFTDYPAAYGQMGDFFGGLLNPVLAFASFMALLYTIKIQTDELQLTRAELERAANAAQKSAELEGDNLQLKLKLEDRREDFYSYKQDRERLIYLLTEIEEKLNFLPHEYVFDFHGNRVAGCISDSIYNIYLSAGSAQAFANKISSLRKQKFVPSYDLLIKDSKRLMEAAQGYFDRIKNSIYCDDVDLLQEDLNYKSEMFRCYLILKTE